jgi:hypothetical protein
MTLRVSEQISVFGMFSHLTLVGMVIKPKTLVRLAKPVIT